MICKPILLIHTLNDQTLLFLTIQFSMSQQNQMVLILFCINNQLFVYAQLNDQTVLFQTI